MRRRHKSGMTRWSPDALVYRLSRIGHRERATTVLRPPVSRCERRYKTGVLSNMAI
jgi:hypothetical protein